MERQGTHHRSKEAAEIIAYLLGRLTEAESDRFEQRYLDDPDLFKEMQEIEDEIIDDFASGLLPEDDQIPFEQHFLRSTNRREKVKFAVAMIERSASWKSENDAESPGSGVITQSSVEVLREAGHSKVLPFRRWMRPVPVWREWGAVAAAILIAIGASMLWLRNRELRNDLTIANIEERRLQESARSESARADQVQAALSESERERIGLAQLQQTPVPSEERRQPMAAKAFSAFVPFEHFSPTTMGTADIKKKGLDVPSSARAIDLTVVFERTRFRIFTARLDRADGTSSWPMPGNFAGRSVGGRQTVTLKIPAKGLSGDYWLGINGVGPAGNQESVGSYYLIVSRR